MDNDILDERSREFLETADQYITEHGHQHVSEEDNKQLVRGQHNLPEEFRIGKFAHQFKKKKMKKVMTTKNYNIITYVNCF